MIFLNPKTLTTDQHWVLVSHQAGPQVQRIFWHVFWAIPALPGGRFFIPQELCNR